MKKANWKSWSSLPAAEWLVKGFLYCRLQISFLSQRPVCQHRAQQVYAIHASDMSIELAMLDSLASQDDTALPILPHLLKVPRQSEAAEICYEQSSVNAASIAENFNLNEDQTRALCSTAIWFPTAPSQVCKSQPPIYCQACSKFPETAPYTLRTRQWQVCILPVYILQE